MDRAYMKLAGGGGPAAPNGGTGIATGTSGQVVILSGTSDINTVSPASSGIRCAQTT